MADEKKTKKPRRADFETTEGRNYLTYLFRDRHFTDKQAADEIGITPRTLINWRKRSKAIADACMIGKSTTDTMVENALLQQALKGNVEACKYWLNNRKRNQWRPAWIYEDTNDQRDEGIQQFVRATNSTPKEIAAFFAEVDDKDEDESVMADNE